MYVNVMTIEEIKPGQTDKGKAYYKCKLVDRRMVKDGSKTYVAYLVYGTFWDEHPNATEGDTVLLSADLVNNYYKDKDGNSKTSQELRFINILKNYGSDYMPQVEDSSGVPF